MAQSSWERFKKWRELPWKRFETQLDRALKADFGLTEAIHLRKQYIEDVWEEFGSRWRGYNTELTGAIFGCKESELNRPPFEFIHRLAPDPAFDEPDSFIPLCRARVWQTDSSLYAEVIITSSGSRFSIHGGKADTTREEYWAIARTYKKLIEYVEKRGRKKPSEEEMKIIDQLITNACHELRSAGRPRTLESVALIMEKDPKTLKSYLKKPLSSY